jgi:hypothetical protein
MVGLWFLIRKGLYQAEFWLGYVTASFLIILLGVLEVLFLG